MDKIIFQNQTTVGFSEEFVTNGITTIAASGTFDGAILKLQIKQTGLGFDWTYTGDTLNESHLSDYLLGTRRANFRFELIDAGASTDLTVMVGG